MAHDLGAELFEQLARDGADRDAGGRFARAGALEHVADVVVAVFHDAREIGVAGPGPRHGRTVGSGRAGRLLRLHVHRALPVLPVLVRDHQGDRRAGGEAVTDAAERLGAVRLDGHAAAAAVPALTAPQLGRDRFEIDRQTRRQAFENGDERLAVRLARCEKTQHRCLILSELFAHSDRGRAMLRAIPSGDDLAAT